MAENVVEILVRSVNDTRRGFDAARADSEKAGDSAGYAFGYAFQKRVSQMMMGLAGAGGGGAGGEASFLETFGAQFGGLAAGALVAAPAIAAVVTEVVALASGFAAATAGAGAFALFARPTFQQLQGDVQQLTTLYNNLQTAQDKLAIAQGNYSADPTKANKAALTSAQRGLLTAQTNLQAAQMGLGQDAGGAATAVLQLRTEYDKLSASLQPQVFQILADGLQAVTKFLPALAPMATAFANALDPLLKRLGEFVQSKGFQDWLTKFDQIIGPATTAIGNGVGKVVVAIGNLFTIMSSHDVVHALNILFDVLAGFFNILATWIKGAMRNWDAMSGSAKEAWSNIKKWTGEAIQFILGQFGTLLNAAARAFGWIPGLGGLLRTASANFNTWATGVMGNLDGVAGHAQAAMGAIQSAAYAGLHLDGLQAAAQGGVNRFGGLASSRIPSKVGHLAGGGPGSGWTKVGEYGPELVDLPSGSWVHPAGSFGGGGTQIVMNWGSPQTQALVRALWPNLQLEVRNRGGGGPKSAQIALGQTH